MADQPEGRGHSDGPSVPAHRFINPESLLPPMGFSHVAVAAPGRLVFVAGQTAHQADGRIVGDTMAEQAEQALRNLVTALAAAGAVPEQVVAMHIYVTDVGAYRDSLTQIGPAWRANLGRHYPAISLFGVTELFDPEAKIEIVATAVVPNQS
jgi:enamine deaminase RidA (YjgF/YER057c/UK114 family)